MANKRYCTFSSNKKGSGGGAKCGVLHQHLKTKARTTIKNCLFYNNESATYGGAVSYYLSDPLIRQCTFADNGAAYGVGIACAGISTIEKSSFQYNQAGFNGSCGSGSGGGIYISGITFLRDYSFIRNVGMESV